MVYWIDYAFHATGSKHSFIWRVPTILQCVFLVPMLFIVFIIPETPRWLVAHDRNEEALEVLMRLNQSRMTDDEISFIHAGIVQAVALENSVDAGSWKDLLKNDSKSARPNYLLLGISTGRHLG